MLPGRGLWRYVARSRSAAFMPLRNRLRQSFSRGAGSREHGVEAGRTPRPGPMHHRRIKSPRAGRLQTSSEKTVVFPLSENCLLLALRWSDMHAGCEEIGALRKSRSVWSARSLLPLFDCPQTAPASWSHSPVRRDSAGFGCGLSAMCLLPFRGHEWNETAVNSISLPHGSAAKIIFRLDSLCPSAPARIFAKRKAEYV